MVSAFHAGDEIVLVLVTYALFLILEDFASCCSVSIHSGVAAYSLLGNIEMGSLVYPVYSLVLVAVSCWSAWRWRCSTARARQNPRAVIHDRNGMAVGINVSRVCLVTFTVGVLAALGGLTAPPRRWPGIGAEVIVLACHRCSRRARQPEQRRHRCAAGRPGRSGAVHTGPKWNCSAFMS